MTTAYCTSDHHAASDMKLSPEDCAICCRIYLKLSFIYHDIMYINIYIYVYFLHILYDNSDEVVLQMHMVLIARDWKAYDIMCVCVCVLCNVLPQAI